MSTLIRGLAVILLITPAFAQYSVGTYGATTVVTGPNGQPAWQLLSDINGVGYAGVYLTINGTLTPTTLTQLSADYLMTLGTFGGGAPRFSIIDTTNNARNEAYVYWGTPAGGGTFTDPHSGASTFNNTGNYANLSSADIRVYSNGFGGFGNGNTGQTWAQFVASVPNVPIGYITVDLDGGFTGTQRMLLQNFNVNGTTYNAPLFVTVTGCQPLAISLAAPAPSPNGESITLTTSDPSKLTFENGLTSLIVFFPAGSTTPSDRRPPQVCGVNFGLATITASGGTLAGGNTISALVTASLSFAPSSVTITGGRQARVNLVLSSPAPPSGLTVNLSSGNTAVATVPATVTFSPGSSSVVVEVNPVGSGTTSIQASATNVMGATLNVTVP